MQCLCGLREFRQKDSGKLSLGTVESLFETIGNELTGEIAVDRLRGFIVNVHEKLLSGLSDCRVRNPS